MTFPESLFLIHVHRIMMKKIMFNYWFSPCKSFLQSINKLQCWKIHRLFDKGV